MSAKSSERLYFIQHEILPCLSTGTTIHKILDKALSIKRIHQLLENTSHRVTIRQVRRDLSFLTEQEFVCNCSVSNEARYYVTPEETSDANAYIQNLPKHRTLVASSLGVVAPSAPRAMKNDYPQKLTDSEVENRFIEKHGYLSLVPSEDIKSQIQLIKHALKMQHRMTFDYEKSSNGRISRKEINPIGVINDCGSYLLVGTKVGHGVEGERRYKIAKMSNLNVLQGVRFFPQLSVKQVVDILYSGREDYTLTNAKNETVHLVIKKDVADIFSSSMIEGARNWNFVWKDHKQKIAELTFTYDISVNFLKGLLSFGSGVEVIGSQYLIKALAVQKDVEPSRRKVAMESILANSA